MIPLFYVTLWNTESPDNERTSLLSVTKMPPLFLDNYLGSSWIKNLEKTCQIESDTKRPSIVSQVFCIPTYSLLLLLQLKFSDLMDISVKMKQKNLRCKSYFRSIQLNQIENLFPVIWRGTLLVTLQKVVSNFRSILCTLLISHSQDHCDPFLHLFEMKSCQFDLFFWDATWACLCLAALFLCLLCVVQNLWAFDPTILVCPDRVTKIPQGEIVVIKTTWQ